MVQRGLNHREESAHPVVRCNEDLRFGDKLQQSSRIETTSSAAMPTLNARNIAGASAAAADTHPMWQRSTEPEGRA